MYVMNIPLTYKVFSCFCKKTVLVFWKQSDQNDDVDLRVHYMEEYC